MIFFSGSEIAFKTLKNALVSRVFNGFNVAFHHKKPDGGSGLFHFLLRDDDTGKQIPGVPILFGQFRCNGMEPDKTNPSAEQLPIGLKQFFFRENS